MMDISAKVERGINRCIVVREGKDFFGTVVQTCQEDGPVLEFRWRNSKVVGVTEGFYLLG